MSTSRLAAMATALSHRGPDGTGFAAWSRGGSLQVSETLAQLEGRAVDVGLVHTRLAILDPRHESDQPFVAPDGATALVYNGETYNFLELRRDLERRGHRFHTDGDTEVVLAAYREWGIDCVTRFVGMWALAILDTRRGRLLLSRDRFGIKPLYLRPLRNGIAFASEIKALRELGSVAANREVTTRYLASGAIASGGTETFFDEIRAVPAAHWLTIDLGQPQRPPRSERYWKIPTEQIDVGRAEGAELLRERLDESVRLHLRSDVPLGSCLSGGIDSSSIVALASRLHMAERARASYASFGFCSEDPSVSEREFMEIVARATAQDFVPVVASMNDIDRDVATALAHQDEPCGSASILAQWFVFQRARQAGVKVMLDGQGADELLAGYHYTVQFLAQLHLRQGHVLRFARLRRQMRTELGISPTSGWRTLRRVLPARPTWLQPRRTQEGGGTGPLTPQALAVARGSERPWVQAASLSEYLGRQLLEQGLPELLRYEDRNSMAHSIEARVPFLDHRLVELAASLPDGLKLRGATTKAVLRDAMRGTVPDAILDRRDKIGFRPTPGWTFEYARRHASDLDSNLTALERELVTPNAISTLVAEGQDTEAEFALWRLVNFKIWARQHEL